MRNKSKNFVISFVALLIFFVSATLISNISYNNNQNLVSNPPDFYAISKEVSIDEFKTYLKENNISAYLPTIIPEKLILTAIYLEEEPFVVIVVYSADFNKDYKTAELTIQISLANYKPDYNELVSNIHNPETEIALQINTWPLLVNEKASAGEESSFIAKYGEYTVLTMLWIQNTQFYINSPTYTLLDVITLVENMQQLL